jgi:hypothetical protein
MLPNHEELVRAMAERTSAQAERDARDRGFRRDGREHTHQVTRVDQPTRQPAPDHRPCPPPCPERVTGLAG